MEKSCGTCGYGWTRDNGNISCGAPVDDEALGQGSVGKNPAWAWRKYGPFAIAALSNPKFQTDKNTDCENMAVDDGKLCAAWKPK